MDNRIIEIVHKNKIGHLGSCLTALPILEHIYKKYTKCNTNRYFVWNFSKSTKSI